jgi:GGDEF domain-containing protein
MRCCARLLRIRSVRGDRLTWLAAGVARSFAGLPTPAEAGDESAHQVGEQLGAAVAGASSLLSRGQTCSITASLGVATGRVGPDAAEALMALLRRADKALYAAKALGRNRCVVAEEPDPPRTTL